MERKIGVAAALVLSATIMGCGTIKTSELVPDVVAKDYKCERTPPQSALLVTPQLSADPVVAAQSARLQAQFQVESVSSGIEFVKTAMPDELQKEPVVQELLKAVGNSVNIAQSDVVARAGLSSSLLSVSNPQNVSSPADLNGWDFESFATTVRKLLFNAPISYGADSTVASIQSDPSAQNIQVAKANFGKIFVAYFSAYYDGKYVDRFGTKLSKPALSRTIGNEEIGGVITVLMELILDVALKTPVWKDSSGKYYPGTFEDGAKPTALAANVPVLELITDSHQCGITVLKAEAIAYIAHAASSKASMAGGLVGGSFGGLHFGFGILGKFSVGDNQTLKVLVTSALAKVFERAGEEMSYRVLYWMPYDTNNLAALLQQYLAASPHKAGT